LGFAAGGVIGMGGRELLPDALAQGPRRAVVADAVSSFAVMLAFQLRLAA
jgi:hypothetical protein